MSWRIQKTTIPGRLGSYDICSRIHDEEVVVMIFRNGQALPINGFEARKNVFEAIEMALHKGVSIVSSFVQEAETYIRTNL